MLSAFVICAAISIVALTIDRLLKFWQKQEQDKFDRLTRARQS